MPVSPAFRRGWLACATTGAVLLGACHRGGWDITRYKDNDALYRSAVVEYQRKKWDNALLAFEKLSLELPARDTLLPRTLWYLAKVHEAQSDHLLAAQSYTRLTESFPDDSLSDDALYFAGQNYGRLWRKPALDAEYGETALNTYRTMLTMYPNSPLNPKAQQEVSRLNAWFADKTYENGMFYFRRKGYDSAIIYFKDVVKLYPEVQRVKDAELRLVQSYRAIKYKDDAADACAALQKSWARDREVLQLCGSPAPVAVTPRDTTVVPKPVP
ncbi:MAG: outer membrane protein assembly factor BamD [Gemmatimonadaceae bacterium]